MSIHRVSGKLISRFHVHMLTARKIFATIGTPEKRKFLRDTFGILDEQIYSSRSTNFASELMAATGGKGVNIILNSLTGELLDESWRCISDGGTMIEIGKKDILARNNLSLEPFNRNASFHGLDMAHNQVSDKTIGRYVMMAR